MDVELRLSFLLNLEIGIETLTLTLPLELACLSPVELLCCLLLEIIVLPGLTFCIEEICCFTIPSDAIGKLFPVFTDTFFDSFESELFSLDKRVGDRTGDELEGSCKEEVEIEEPDEVKLTGSVRNLLV